MAFLCCIPSSTSLSQSRQPTATVTIAPASKAVDALVTQQPQNPPSLFWYTQPAAPVTVKGPYILFSRGTSDPPSELVRLAFYIKKVDVQLVKWKSEEPLPVWFNTASPSGSLPIMQFPDGSYSSNIIDMITRFDKDSLTPSLFLDALECQEWIAFIQQTFLPHFNSVLVNSNPSVQAESRVRLNDALRKISTQLERNNNASFLLGNAITFADIFLAPFLHRLELVSFFRGINFTSNELLTRYIQTLQSQDFISKSSILPSISELKAYYVSTIEKERPASIVRLQHIAIKHHMDKVVSTATQMSHGFVQDMTESAETLHSRFHKLLQLLRIHAAMEQNVVFPAFLENSTKVIEKLVAEHEREDTQLLALEVEVDKVLERITKLGEAKKFPRSDEFKGFVGSLRNLAVGQRVHMAGEDSDLAPLFSGLSQAEERVLFEKMYSNLEPSNRETIPLIVEALGAPERAQYLSNVRSLSNSQQVAEFTAIWKAYFSKEEWEDTKFRLAI
ncbi:UNVERIFIED_CONTAM: hypothetical protein HDU68_012406 [Siphonaria sp. JEL0065]|nr:hypothetical protein HDU68_012406 [Siphonaria sp. JEL0065]